MIASFRADAATGPRAGWARRLCHSTPHVLHNLVGHARQAMLPWVNFRLPVTLLHGPIAGSAGAARILVAGAWPWADYLPYRFFAAPPQRECLGHVPLWDLRSFVESRRREVDMAVIRVDRLSVRLFFANGYLVVPEAVGSRITVPVDLARLERRSKSVKDDVRRVRRDGLEPRISHALSDFDLFYLRMYVPFLRRRHGDFAVVRGRHHLRRAFRQGGILWVYRGEERIAGAVFELRHRILHLVAVGTADGRLDLAQQGALAALYIFLLRSALTYGCVEIDCGSSAPILNDGLLRYKAKWGGRLTRMNPPYHYLMRWESSNHVIRAFLRQLPLIFKTPAGGLCGLTALEEAASGRDMEAAPIERALPTEGLERLFIMVPPGNVSTGIDTGSPERDRPGPTDHCRTILCTPAEFISSMDQGPIHPRWRGVSGPSVDRTRRPGRSVS